MKQRWVAAALALMLAGPALAANVGQGAYTPATVGTADAVIAGPYAGTNILDIANNSATATICLNFGAAATITGSVCAAGEITLPPLGHRSWESNFVPADAIHAIASAASTPATVGAK